MHLIFKFLFNCCYFARGDRKRGGERRSEGGMREEWGWEGRGRDEGGGKGVMARGE